MISYEFLLYITYNESIISVFVFFFTIKVAALTAQLASAGKPSGFALLDSNGRLSQSLLEAGYDKYSWYDLGWQSLHMAAAGACRGSTLLGGSGCCGNVVVARNAADKKSCTELCAQTVYNNCDAGVSIYGRQGKATENGEVVGSFYNYPCSYVDHGGSEASSPDEGIRDHSWYFSFCCCRKG